MAKLINVFCVSDYFLPGFLGGGPITTLANMRKVLQGKVTLSIFTRDRDLGTSSQYKEIKTNQWLDTQDGPVYYATPNCFGPRGIKNAIKQFDFNIVYLNSFFSPRASILPYLILRRLPFKRPIVLAPRGEFSPGAISIKGTKKKLYLTLTRFFGLYQDIFWHASTKMEANDIANLFPDATERILIAADPVLTNDIDTEHSRSEKETGHLRIAFVSRISPMKNLDGLLRILSLVSMPIKLDVFGPIEDERYWKTCNELIEQLPHNIEVTAHGAIPPNSVSQTFSRFDVFAFPTHGENFGHVIFESLRAGTPVLLSEKTAWKPDNTEALTIIPLGDTSGWRAAIEQAANRSSEEQKQLVKAARSYARTYINNMSAIHENLQLFQKALGRKSNPERN